VPLGRQAPPSAQEKPPGHTAHTAPFAPHAVCEVPGLQTPVAVQQPLQLVALQEVLLEQPLDSAASDAARKNEKARIGNAPSGLSGRC
jgi:hypothetical protein